MHMPAVCHQANWKRPERNSTGCRKWELSADLPVHGHPHYTWCLKSLEVGVHVATIDASMRLPFLIAPYSGFYSPPGREARRLTLCADTTRYQSLQQTYRKLPSSPHLGFSSSSECHLASRTRPRLSSD